MMITIVDTLKENGGAATWSQLREGISEKHQVKNWLTGPRAHLQSLINEGVIIRADSIKYEVYQLN